MRPPGPRAMGLWLLSSVLVVVLLASPAISMLVCLSSAAVIVSRGGRIRGYLVLGLGITAIRTLLFALTGHEGETVLLSLPTVSLPAFLGGLQIGGPVVLEVLLVGMSEGIRLMAVIMSFGAFVRICDTASLLKMVPSWISSSALVVNIAVTLAPSLSRSFANIREAQAMRGIKPRSRMSVRSTLVPAVSGAIERSIGLAESMEARGYGIRPLAPRPRLLALTSALAIATCATLAAIGLRWALAAIPVLLIPLVIATRRLADAGTTKLTPDDRPWLSPVSWVAAVTILGTIGVSLLGPRAATTGAWPPPSPLEVVIAMTTVVPALSRVDRTAA